MYQLTFTISRHVLVCFSRLGSALPLSKLAFSLMCLVAVPASGVTFMVDPIQGAGVVEVDAGPLPQILGAPVGTPLELDYVFNDMKHVMLSDGASTNIEFGVGNTTNNVDLDYRIVVDLSDMNGNLITNEAIVVEGTASAGFINLHDLPLQPLPSITFHDFHIAVDTVFAEPVGDGLFDFYVAGGGGDPGTGASGPVRFNRATVGVWVPEPSSAVLILPLALVGWYWMATTRQPRDGESRHHSTRHSSCAE